MWQKLYTLDKSGKVRTFCGNVIPGPTTGYETITGLLGGKATSKFTKVSKGKQNRTVIEQAEFELTSKYSDKRSEGYKSINELLDKYVVMLPASNTSKNSNNTLAINYDPSFILTLLNKLPEASYTNSNWDELPMLAMRKEKVKLDLNKNYFIQPKLNGVRSLSKLRERVILSSRGGEYYSIPHIEEQLMSIFSEIGKDYILDGEIYKHGVSLQEISGAARKKELGLFSNNWLEYHIYDIADNTLPQRERIFILNKLQHRYGSSPAHSSIRFVRTDLTNPSAENLKHYHDKFIADGYEGAIIRDEEFKYEFNVRSNNLIKMKEYEEEEFEIVGGKINLNKTIGESFVFELRNNINSLTFEARPTGTAEQKEFWWNHIESYAGKMATIRFFERSDKGLPLQGCLKHKDSDYLIVEHIRPKGE